METIKLGSGKRKIEIQKIKDKTSLQVAFSKRKATLLDKASELSILCGAQVAVILFSPAGNAFACGHPTPDHTLDRFLNNSSEAHGGDDDELSVCQQRYMEVERELEAETKRGLMLEALVNPNDIDLFGWDAYIDGLSLNELGKMRSDMEQLQKIVEKRCEEMMMMMMSPDIPSSSESLPWMTMPDATDIEDDDMTVNIGRILENGYGADDYLWSSNKDEFVCNFNSPYDFENDEMINELLSGFHSQQYEFGTAPTTSTDQTISGDMFSDDY